MTNRSIIFTLLILSFTALRAEDSIDYRPKIHGVARARFEQSTVENVSHFQLRNARVNVSGMVAPWADYFVQADLCDRGKMTFLDGYARVKYNGWALQAGQFRMPFGIDPFRAPGNYIFANRSYLANQVCNYRAVGMQLGYNLPKLPLTLQAGAFNPGTIADHTPWHRSMAYATRAQLKLGGFNIEAGYMSTKPADVRVNLIDGALTWSHAGFTASAEYIYRAYCHDRHKPTHAYLVLGDYSRPIDNKVINRWSVQARFDGMTDCSSAMGTVGADGQLSTTAVARNRITVGGTIGHYQSKDMHILLRADYEKMFFHAGVNPTPDMGDKAVVELVVKF